ncbi:MAG: hypothetical protein ACM3O9_02535 [Methylocystaceae bacterium]
MNSKIKSYFILIAVITTMLSLVASFINVDLHPLTINVAVEFVGGKLVGSVLAGITSGVIAYSAWQNGLIFRYKVSEGD